MPAYKVIAALLAPVLLVLGFIGWEDVRTVLNAQEDE